MEKIYYIALELCKKWTVTAPWQQDKENQHASISSNFNKISIFVITNQVWANQNLIQNWKTFERESKVDLSVGTSENMDLL